uniref:Uncharacterized protein n=1 Tax=Romanomermis culicivorax TaxID=13658 RepID=A0A915KWH0_ROMCU
MIKAANNTSDSLRPVSHDMETKYDILDIFQNYRNKFRCALETQYPENIGASRRLRMTFFSKLQNTSLINHFDLKIFTDILSSLAEKWILSSEEI